MFTIKDRKFLQSDTDKVLYTESPNHSGNFVNSVRYVVIHYTAGRLDNDNSHRWLCNKDANASAHLVIYREPEREIHQLGPFDRVMWHAGTSHYAGLTGLNRYSIGIELANPGALKPLGNGKYETAWGQILSKDEYDIIDAPYPNDSTNVVGWLKYTPEQINRTIEIISRLKEAIPTITDVVGHSDIAPNRKVDPGPAFPMSMVREKVFNHTLHVPRTQVIGGPTIKGVTTARLNLRNMPTLSGKILTTLPEGHPVKIIVRDLNWYEVDAGDYGHGFVSADYILLV